MRPCSADAAIPTAQWQAALTSQALPASIDSNAPSRTSRGASSVVCIGRADQGAGDAHARSTHELVVQPLVLEVAFSSATHSCRRPCGWMRNFAIARPLPGADASLAQPTRRRGEVKSWPSAERRRDRGAAGPPSAGLRCPTLAGGQDPFDQ